MRKADLNPTSLGYLEAFKDQVVGGGGWQGGETEIPQYNFCLISMPKMIPKWCELFF